MAVTECSYFFCLWAVVCTGYLRRDEGLPNESVSHSFSSAISSCYLHLGFLLPARMNGMPYVSKIVLKFNSNCTSRVSIALHESIDFTVRSFCWRAFSLHQHKRCFLKVLNTPGHHCRLSGVQIFLWLRETHLLNKLLNSPYSVVWCCHLIRTLWNQEVQSCDQLVGR